MTEPIFYQDAYHNWHYCTVENSWHVYDLPLGAKFQTINAPLEGVNKVWLRTLFRVDMYYDAAHKRMTRGYIAEHSQHYDACPVAPEFIVFSERDCQ